MKLFSNKLFSLVMIILFYILAFVGAYFAFEYIPIDAILVRFLLADVIATIIIFIGSLLFKNASVYDPYWSVAPMVMVLFFAHHSTGFHLFNLFIIIVIELWGLRLTVNWLVRFKNLKTQDWRYTHFQNKYPKLYPLINFFGIHLAPTLIVYFGMLPVFAYMDAFGKVPAENLNMTIIISMVVALIAIGIEMIADIQMNQFRKNPNNMGKVNCHGLWKISRHPNYFGEILFWISMFLFALSVRSDLWVLIFCPLIIFLLFGVVSIPLLEKRELASKPEYADYKMKTNLLLPIFPPNPEIVEARQKRNNEKRKRGK